MASTNKTTNYELSQFIETDRPAWLTDYNGDMRKLDTALKAVSDIASGASGGIASLTDRMTAAEGAITTNTNDITALDARTDALEAGAQSQAGTIAGIQTEQITQNAGIEAATQLGYNLARPYDSASTYAVGAYVLFQNTLYKCVTAISTGEAFDPTKWLAIKATDEISAGGVTAEHFRYLGLQNTLFTGVNSVDLIKYNFDGTEARYTLSNFSNFNIGNSYIQGGKIGNLKVGTLYLSFGFTTITGLAKSGVFSLDVSMTYNREDPAYEILHNGFIYPLSPGSSVGATGGNIFDMRSYFSWGNRTFTAISYGITMRSSNTDASDISITIPFVVAPEM